jgi:histidyl-tRNA synthetase
MSPRFGLPRGTYDVLPRDQPLRRHVVGEFERLCALYGYRPIQTPVFEDTELFARTAGDSSDVVRKEMYTFTDRGDRSLTLRAEATAPIVRAYLEHGLHREPQPQKLYTVASIFRYGRPQKGRYREHWQLDIEAIGSEEPAVDAEVIQLYASLLGRLGVTEYRLELNSIGDRTCRPRYLATLRPWLAQREAELDEETREQARRNPLRALDNIAGKPPHVQQVLRGAPAIGDSLCDECRSHFEAVRAHLDAYGVGYELVPTLVRGLDYYTRTTWEFVGLEGGSTSTLSGGGRYDGLAEELGGPPTPGVGFGAGIERLLLAVEAAGLEVAPPKIDVFFAFEDGVEHEPWRRVMAQLRDAGRACDTDYAGRSLKGQLTQSVRLGAGITVIADGADRATIRAAGESDATVARDELVAYVLSRTEALV